jgi:hypothetical protein
VALYFSTLAEGGIVLFDMSWVALYFSTSEGGIVLFDISGGGIISTLAEGGIILFDQETATGRSYLYTVHYSVLSVSSRNKTGNKHTKVIQSLSESFPEVVQKLSNTKAFAQCSHKIGRQHPQNGSSSPELSCKF